MTTLDNSNSTLIKLPTEISGPWLGAVLGLDEASLLGTKRIGTGQMSSSYRVRFAAAGGPERSVVVKLASDDEGSRATGVGMGAYYREVAFYQDLAPRLGSALPACHLALYDASEGWFTLVLEDIVDAESGDQIAGCT